jgi:AAA15 family ATPase/GTPase
MLLRFTAKNYRSFKDEQELALVAATKIVDAAHDAIEVPGLRQKVLPLAAIYGANASGKSTVLKALRFVERAVLRSQNDWGPSESIDVDPFLLDKEGSASPSEFEVDVLIEGVRYKYGFSVDRTRFIREWLYAFPQGKTQKWFDRDANRTPEYKFSRNLGGQNQRIKDLTRPNSLYLSAAAQNNHPKLGVLQQWFAKSLYVLFERDPRALGMAAGERIADDPALRLAVVELLKLADLGITDVKVTKEEITGRAKELLAAFASADPDFHKHMQEHPPQIPDINFMHAAAAGMAPVQLPFREESTGTQGIFGLAPRIVAALANGHTLCIDELDASLHPLIIAEVVKLFSDRKTNPRHGQLIFNTHDTNVLACGLLRRDEIWFTEKSRTGASRLFPLSDYHPRKEENIVRGYLQGRYGAVPFIGGGEAFIKQLKRNSVRTNVP